MDAVQHLSSRHTIGLQHLSRMLAYHGKGSNPCPRYNENPSDGNLTDHVLTVHNDFITFQLKLTAETQLDHLVDRNLLFTC